MSVKKIGENFVIENDAGWKSLKIKYVADLIIKKDNNSSKRYIGLEHVKSNLGELSEETDYVPEGDTLGFNENDVLFGKLRPYLAKCFKAEFSGRCSSEFFVIRPFERDMSDYLKYLFLSDQFIHCVNASTYGAKMPRVNWDYFGNILIPVPEAKHALKISRFLDKETSKIDNLIEKKQRLIELLQEKRQALITNAVTKGLEHNVPMKDSGIPWLGEIPEHWDVKKLKYIARMVGGSTPFKDNLEFWNGDIPWVSPKDMKADFIHTSKDYITHLGVIDNNLELVPENSTLIVVRSGILKHTLPVAMTKIKVTLNQDMKALIPKSNFLISEYLFWMFKGLAKSVLNNSWKIGATVDSIEIELLENLFFPIPSREEQQTIINYLESRTLKINKLISKLQTQITKLQEYRQALITAAVTGKIDVREKVSS